MRACLTATGLSDGLTPITDESKFIDFALSSLLDDLLNWETVTILFFFSPILQVIPDPFCLFPFLKKSPTLMSANYRFKIREVSQLVE